MNTFASEETRQLIREFKVIGCGSCKGTGERHTWDAKADLVQTGEICQVCEGTGIAPPRKSA